MAEEKRNGHKDYVLIVTVFLLVIVGLVILYSASAYNGRVKFHDSFYYLKKQVFATILGIFCMYIVAGIDYHVWQKVAVHGYLAAIGLSVAVMLWGKEYMVVFGPFFFSAIGIFQGGTDYFYCVGGDAQPEKDWENANPD